MNFVSCHPVPMIKAFINRIAIICYMLLYCTSWTIAQPATNLASNNSAFVYWAQRHVWPLQSSAKATDDSDLYPVKEMIGEARVVALGEPAHGYREPLAFRNRLFKFFVKHCGFTTMAVEGGLAESQLATEYIAGGSGTAEAAAAALGIGDPAPENIELLEWMRQYNSDTAHQQKLMFYGIDIQIVGFPGDTIPNHRALSQALAYLHQVDPVSTPG